MKNYKAAFMLVFCLFISTKIFAGNGWGASGGSFMKDLANPWFISNTEFISYCIVLNEKEISVEKASIRKAIVNAFSYWKEQFKYASYGFSAEKFIKTGFQTPIEKDCPRGPKEIDSSIDLVFQFGKLSRKQKKDPVFQGILKVIGVAIRTDYDKKLLKGRGFIYVNPDRGPNSVKDETVENDYLSKGNVLLSILIHELGHVFGIRHHGSKFDVMGEGFLANIIRKPKELPIQLRNEIGSSIFFRNVFKPSAGILMSKGETARCFEERREKIIGGFLSFFEIDRNAQCFSISKIRGKWEVFYKMTPDSEPIVHGELIVDDIPTDTRRQTVSNFYLTKEQKIIPQEEINWWFFPNISVVEETRQGKFIRYSDGKEKSITLRTSPSRSIIGGVFEGKIFPDLFKIGK